MNEERAPEIENEVLEEEEVEEDIVERIDENYSRRFIRPAQDIVDDTLFFGLWVPLKNGEEEPGIEYCWVNDKRQLLTVREMLQMGLVPRSILSSMVEEPRWPLRHLKKWLKGEVSAPSPKELLRHLRNIFIEFVDFEPEADLYTFVSLWSIGTYMYMVFSTYPYLLIMGVPESGKSRLLTVLHGICFNATFLAETSTANLFRTIELFQSTLLIDEAELLSGESKKDLKLILNAGYQKNRAGAGRTEKKKGRGGIEKFIPTSYFLYSPKAIACIQGVDSVLGSRCVPIIMRRTKYDKYKIRFPPPPEDPLFANTRAMMYAFALENWKRVQEIHKELTLPFDMSGRDWELLGPIVAIAEYMGVYDEIEQLLRSLVEHRRSTMIIENRDLTLLQALAMHVQKDDWYQVSQISDWMVRAIGIDKKPRWLTPQWVGRSLMRLGFLKKKRTRLGVEYYITKEGIEDAATRLGVPLDGEALTAQPAGMDKTLVEIITSTVVWATKHADVDGTIEQLAVLDFLRSQGLSDYEAERVIDIMIRDEYFAPSPDMGKLVLLKKATKPPGNEVDELDL